MKPIDMSHVLIPGSTGRKLVLETIGADEVNPNVVRLPNQWYIMHQVSMVNHLGTHIEAPYHLFKDGDDLARLALDKLCGATVILDLRNLEPKSAITPQQLQAAAFAAGGIRPGDIVLCNLGYASFYGQPEYQKSPYFSNEAILWLVGTGMKMMGVDAGGVEIPGNEQHINHAALFKNGIPLLENVAGFDKLTKDRVQLYAFPIAVQGLDSFPVRVVAFEE